MPKRYDAVIIGGGHNGLVMVGVGEIGPSPHQPRRAFDQVSLERLADSIRRSGMMQPVILRPAITVGGSAYELVAGERRWRAAKMAGLSQMPALVRELSDEESAEWALVENVQRDDLNAMERAWAFRSLVENAEFNQWICGRTPAGRWGQPHELAGAAIFLASHASDFVNGQILTVDGGLLAAL